jgi:hypothetical protein
MFYSPPGKPKQQNQNGEDSIVPFFSFTDVDSIKKENFQVDALRFFVNPVTGHPSVLVGTSDRTTRVVSVHSSSAGEESDVVISEDDPMYVGMDANVIKLGKQVQLAIGFTGRGTLFMYQIGHPECKYETHIHSTHPAEGHEIKRQVFLCNSVGEGSTKTMLAIASQTEWSLMDVSGMRPWVEYINGGRIVQDDSQRQWAALTLEIKGQRHEIMKNFRKQFYGVDEDEETQEGM